MAISRFALPIQAVLDDAPVSVDADYQVVIYVGEHEIGRIDVVDIYVDEHGDGGPTPSEAVADVLRRIVEKFNA